MDYQELKSEALKLDWRSRLSLAQDLLESLHQRASVKPSVVDKSVPPSGLNSEDFGVLGLDEIVSVNSQSARKVPIPDPPDLLKESNVKPVAEHGDGSSISDSFQKLRDALETKFEVGE